MLKLFLWSDTVQPCRYLLIFWKNLVLPPSGLLYTYNTRRYRIPEDSNPHCHRGEDIRSLKVLIYPVQLSRAICIQHVWQVYFLWCPLLFCGQVWHNIFAYAVQRVKYILIKFSFCIVWVGDHFAVTSFASQSSSYAAEMTEAPHSRGRLHAAYPSAD